MIGINLLLVDRLRRLLRQSVPGYRGGTILLNSKFSRLGVSISQAKLFPVCASTNFTTLSSSTFRYFVLGVIVITLLTSHLMGDTASPFGYNPLSPSVAYADDEIARLVANAAVRVPLLMMLFILSPQSSNVEGSKYHYQISDRIRILPLLNQQ